MQPGAEQGQSTYCPVSGVVFNVQRASARRETKGRTLFFCCESCAQYFAENEPRVLTARGMAL